MKILNFEASDYHLFIFVNQKAFLLKLRIIKPQGIGVFADCPLGVFISFFNGYDIHRAGMLNPFDLSSSDKIFEFHHQ